MSGAIVEELLASCRTHTGGEGDPELVGRAREFYTAVKGDPSLLDGAAAALPHLPPAGAGRLAVTLGGAIETGPGVERTAGPVVDLLLAWLPRLPIPVEGSADEEDSYPEPTPEQEALLAALQELCQSAVAHLARSPVLRERLAQDAALLERLDGLQGYSVGATWVRELLLRTSGPLIVLHPPSGKGFRLRFENIANNFHLFTLLQGTLGARVPGGRKADPAILESARGRSAAERFDHAWWHFGDPRSPQPEIRDSIWGEATVDSIPRVNGVRTILLWPMILSSRGWDASFFHPFLEAAPPNVVLERALTYEESRALIAQLGIAPAPAPSWWERLLRRS